MVLVDKTMTKKRILITGAGGFVGPYLIKELQQYSEYEIYGSVYKDTSSLSNLLSPDHILCGDLNNATVASSHVSAARPDIVYHLAALSVVHNSVDNALSILQANTALSYNTLEAVRTVAPHARFIAICSANEYGSVDVGASIPESAPLRPLNPYAVSKVTQEMLALQYHVAYGMDVVLLRPFNHSGPGQTPDFVLPRLAQKVVTIEQGVSLPSLELGSGSAVRDFTDVRDIVRAYVAIATVGKSGEAYNIGTGIGHTIRKIAEIYQSLSKKKFAIIEKPELARPSDVPILIADVTKLKKLSGWSPMISLEKTISDILEYERKNYGN
jgi:GDP-4-dehydro-6-deoxy-D-mannose reductase